MSRAVLERCPGRSDRSCGAGVAEVVVGTHAAWMVSECVAVVKEKERECRMCVMGLLRADCVGHGAIRTCGGVWVAG